MGQVRLFNRDELEQAFAQLLPPDVARRTAERWFVDYGIAATDPDGYFVWNPEANAGDLADFPHGLIVTDPGISEKDRIRAERRFWEETTVRERVEIVLRFSDLHFALVGLVSDALFERMRAARGLSRKQAETSREHMRRAVEAVRDARS